MRAALAALATLALSAPPAVAGDDFAYVRDPGEWTRAGAVVVDTRPLAACLERTLEGARCLPAGDALGPHRRLASWRDLLWLLGTARLTGRETVLVAGGEAQERDFVAGLLYVAGQAQVKVLVPPVANALAQGAPAGAGHPRDFARGVVFEAPMREDLVVLRHELAAALGSAPLLDGRSADEFHGGRVRAVRGGRIAGAIGAPAAELRTSERDPALPGGRPIAYAHDAVEGFAYFTLLRARFGVDARVYPEGWAAWAADAALPADAVTHPEPAPLAQPPAATTVASPVAWVALALALAAAFAAGLGVANRRTR